MGQSAGAMVVNKPSSGGPVPSEYSLGQIIPSVVTVFNLNGAGHHLTMKPFKALFAPGGVFYSLVINFQIPHLHQQVLKAAPIVAQPTPMDAVFKIRPPLGWRHRYFYCGDYLYLHPRRGHQERDWRLCRNA